MSEEPVQGLTGRQLRIWGQNLNKSLCAQLDFINHLKTNVYDIALIQEPYFDNRGVSHATRGFVSVYPTMHTANQRATCAMILINAKIPSSSWNLIPIPSPDITAIEIFGAFGTIRIINVYNDCKHNTAI
ncbi:hypothetical protein B0H19DRAFT_926574, partial [Mycena capillaripes]